MKLQRNPIGIESEPELLKKENQILNDAYLKDTPPSLNQIYPNK